MWVCEFVCLCVSVLRVGVCWFVGLCVFECLCLFVFVCHVFLCSCVIVNDLCLWICGSGVQGFRVSGFMASGFSFPDF